MTICNCSELYLPTEQMIEIINGRITPRHTTLDLQFNNLYLKSGAELATIFAETLANHPNITTLDLSQNNLWKLHTENTAGNNLKIAFAALPPTITKLILSWNGLNQMTSINLQTALTGIKNHVRIDFEGNNLDYKTPNYRRFIKYLSLDPGKKESRESIINSRCLTTNWRYSAISLNTLYNENFRTELFKTAILSFSKNELCGKEIPKDTFQKHLAPFLTIHDAANLRLACKPQQQ